MKNAATYKALHYTVLPRGIDVIAQLYKLLRQANNNQLHGINFSSCTMMQEHKISKQQFVFISNSDILFKINYFAFVFIFFNITSLDYYVFWCPLLKFAPEASASLPWFWASEVFPRLKYLHLECQYLTPTNLSFKVVLKVPQWMINCIF